MGIKGLRIQGVIELLRSVFEVMKKPDVMALNGPRIQIQYKNFNLPSYLFKMMNLFI